MGDASSTGIPARVGSGTRAEYPRPKTQNSDPSESVPTSDLEPRVHLPTSNPTDQPPDSCYALPSPSSATSEHGSMGRVTHRLCFPPHCHRRRCRLRHFPVLIHVRTFLFIIILSYN